MISLCMTVCGKAGVALVCVVKNSDGGKVVAAVVVVAIVAIAVILIIIA